MDAQDAPDGAEDNLDQELPAPLEQVQEQTILSFEGDPLIAALTTTGNIFVKYPWIHPGASTLHT